MDNLQKSLIGIALGATVTASGLLTGMVYSDNKNSQSEAREMYRLISPTLSDQAENYLVNINPTSGYLMSMSGLILTGAGIKKLKESD